MDVERDNEGFALPPSLITSNKEEESTTPSSSTSSTSSTSSPSPSSDYIPPEWGVEKPKYECYFECLKNGQIIEKIDLSERGYYLIGKLPTCDIVMAHPSIS